MRRFGRKNSRAKPWKMKRAEDSCGLSPLGARREVFPACTHASIVGRVTSDERTEGTACAIGWYYS